LGLADEISDMMKCDRVAAATDVRKYAETASRATACQSLYPRRVHYLRAFPRWVSHHIVKASATQNVDGEHVGVLNKVFAWLYEIHLVGRRIKEWNRKVYYALKYTLTLAVFGLLIASAFK
jgi:beta-hydroxylase